VDLDKALSEIGEIRSQMARQVLFQGFGPVAVVCTGVLALVFVVAQVLAPAVLCASPLNFVFAWVGITFVASIFIVAHMWHRSRLLHGTQSGALLNQVFEQLVPPVCATIAVTWVFTQFSESLANVLPGLWLMFAALACFSMAASLGNRMRFVGGWYFVCGSVVLIAGLKQPLDVLSPWLLAIPFFIGQIAMALVLKLETLGLSAEGDNDD